MVSVLSLVLVVACAALTSANGDNYRLAYRRYNRYRPSYRRYDGYLKSNDDKYTSQDRRYDAYLKSNEDKYTSQDRRYDAYLKSNDDKYTPWIHRPSYRRYDGYQEDKYGTYHDQGNDGNYYNNGYNNNYNRRYYPQRGVTNRFLRPAGRRFFGWPYRG